MWTRNLCSEAAATLFRRDGKTYFVLHRSGESGPLGAFAEALRRSGGGDAVISAWEEIPEAATLAERLSQAGVTVRACFVPEPGKAPWMRRDLAAFRWSGPEEPPEPEYLFLPLPDTPENRLKAPGPFRNGPGFVTVHNTAEPFSALDERRRVKLRRDSRVSFHFAADENRIVQLLPLDRHGWHAGDGDGDGNLRSIGVEICRSAFRHGGDRLYRRAEENAVLLAAALLSALRLPVEALRTHCDWSGKYCPHRILEADAWPEFRRRVAAVAADRAAALAAHIAKNA